MSRSAEPARPAEGEAPFEIGEVFFSRTDPRGVILSGNTIFRRVADYDWPDLIGAPHRLIRHPDMPRGVFQLFWDRLEAGRTVGAYVKNKARDGLHYWVFALVSSVDGGYLSVRIKPASDLFPAVQELYADLLAREAEERLKPEDAAGILLERIAQLGFADFDAFMAEALSREIAAHEAALGRAAQHWRESLDLLSSRIADLTRESAALTAQFESIRVVPTNLGIAAVSLGDAGRPIAVIAENYAMMCREVFGKLSVMNSSGETGLSGIAGATIRARILNGFAHLQNEAAEAFAAETDDTPVNRAGEIALLSAQKDTMRQNATESLRAVRQRVSSLGMTFQEFSRLLRGLDVTRILCRVEAGRLPPAQGTALIGIIDSLDTFHGALSKRLETLDALTLEISDVSDMLSASERPAVRRRVA